MKGKLATIILLATIGFYSEARSQWVQTNGPYGASVTALASIGSNVFAATGESSGGLFLTTDNGSTWARLDVPWGEFGTDALVAVGTNLFAVSGRNIYLTSDNGTSWTKTTSTGLSTLPTCFAVIGSTLYAGIGTYSFVKNDGLYRSTDNGATWVGAGAGLSNPYVHALVASGTDLFAGTSRGICRSSDNGNTWTLIDSGLTYTGIWCLTVHQGNLFAGTSRRGILRSRDNGVSWKAVNPTPVDTMARSFVASGEDLFVATTRGVFRTTDNGDSWLALDSLIGEPDRVFRTNVIALEMSGTNLFAGTWSGVYLTTDKGTAWRDVTTTLNSKGGSVVSCGSLLYNSNGSLFISTDDGMSWQPDSSGLRDPYSIRELGATLVAMTGNGVFSSTDNGAHWARPAHEGLSDQTVIDLRTTLASIGSDLFVSSYTGGVFRSTDLGVSWTAVNNGFTKTYEVPDSNQIVALASIGTDLFAASGIGTIYRSTDRGAEWHMLHTWPEHNNISGLLSIGTDLYVDAGYGDSIYLSTDYGSTWRVVNDGQPAGINASSFTVHEENIFVISGSTGRVFLSRDKGASWEAINQGLPEIWCTSLAIKGTNIFAGTRSAGIWRRPLANFDISSVGETHKTSQLSIQYYPNPVRTTVNLNIDHADGGAVEVRIYNLMGKECARLEGNANSEGLLTLQWNTSMIPSGIYECVTRTSRDQVLTLILVRH